MSKIVRDTTDVALDDAAHRLIGAALARARAHPLLLEEARKIAASVDQDTAHVTLAEREGGVERSRQPEVVRLPGFEVCLSFEEHPLGMCRHISVSVPEPGKVPSEASVVVIGRAFGIQHPLRIWLEEFAPGHQAVNVVGLDDQGTRH